MTASDPLEPGRQLRPEATAAGRPGGFERWLRNPFRLSVLAFAAVIAATAATVLGEVELRSAGGFGAEETELVGRQLGLWTTWALLTPLIVGASVWMVRRSLPWPVIAAVHLPLAAIVASGFLLAEIKVQEIAQGSERTARYREMLEWQESMLELRRQAIEDGRDPWSFGRGRRGGDRGGDRARGAAESGSAGSGDEVVDEVPGDRVPLDAVSPEMGAPDTLDDPGFDRGGREPVDVREGDAPPPRGQRPPPPTGRDDARGDPGGDPRGDDRRRSRRWSRDRGLAANVATGDLAADFQRRWRLRVPRYALVYFTLLGIGLGIRAYLTGRTKEREAQALAVRTSELESDLAQARLETLKGQLHPHFLFNALHSVGGLVRAERSREAVTALDTIGDLLRTSLDSGPEHFVPLGRELELIERYLAVESLRLGDRLRIEFDVPESLLEAEVPAFIAQPLVENAIKHGVAMRPDGGSVTIRAFAEHETTLVIDVEDDGPGLADREQDRAAAPPGGGRGVGLPHVRGRLDALFAGTGSLETTNLHGGGMRARLRLPLEDIEPFDRPPA